MATETPSPNNRQAALEMLKNYNKAQDLELTPQQHLYQALTAFLFSTADFVGSSPGEDKPIVRQAHTDEISLSKKMVAAALERMNYATIALIANGATADRTLHSLLYNTSALFSRAISSANTIQFNLSGLTEDAKTGLTDVIQACTGEKDMTVRFGPYPPIMAEGFGGIGIPMLGYTQVDHYNSPLKPPLQAGELFIASPLYGDLTPVNTTSEFPNKLRNQLCLELLGGDTPSFSSATLTVQRLPETNKK